MRLALAYACFFLFTCWCGPALAQGQAAAEALFRSAQEAADKRDWQTACDRFAESHRLEPAPGTVLNLARCRENLGQIASAWKRYGEVVQRLPAQDPRVAYAKEKEAELVDRVPRVTLRAPDFQRVVTVRLNDVEVSSASFGVPLPVDPGAVELRVDADGREPWRERFDITEGQSLDKQLQVGPPVQEKESGVVDEPRSKSGGKTLAYTALGVGFVGLAAGGAGAGWSLVELSNVNRECEQASTETLCTQSGVDAGQRGQAAVILTGVGLGVGVVGVGLGLYLLGKDKDPKNGRNQPLHERVGFVALEGGGLLTLRGTL